MKINTKIKQISIESEHIIEFAYLRITGIAQLKLMTDDIITHIMFARTSRKNKDFSEEDIFNSVNDGGYGGCRILSADITIYGVYSSAKINDEVVYVPIKKARVDMIKKKITYKKV